MSIRVKARRLLRFIAVPSRTAGEPPGKDASELTIRRNRARLLPRSMASLQCGNVPDGTAKREGERKREFRLLALSRQICFALSPLFALSQFLRVCVPLPLHWRAAKQ